MPKRPSPTPSPAPSPAPSPSPTPSAPSPSAAATTTTTTAAMPSIHAGQLAGRVAALLRGPKPSANRPWTDVAVARELRKRFPEYRDERVAADVKRRVRDILAAGASAGAGAGAGAGANGNANASGNAGA